MKFPSTYSTNLGFALAKLPSLVTGIWALVTRIKLLHNFILVRWGV
ncbi:hypothetical protein [Clostridium sp. ZS2-4]|nr:hypothetical protein [Clostridium sp. ZS2-4]MCY6355400.1 hypothetical protein [Clostridium sp. ZS2-4]